MIWKRVYRGLLDKHINVMIKMKMYRNVVISAPVNGVETNWERHRNINWGSQKCECYWICDL